jgi:hypothetical protein
MRPCVPSASKSWPLELHRVQGGDQARIQAPDPAAQLERAGERCLHGYLLAQNEPQEEGQRTLRQEAIGLVVIREVKALGPSSHHQIVPFRRVTGGWPSYRHAAAERRGLFPLS